MSLFDIFKKKKEPEDNRSYMERMMAQATPEERAFYAAYAAADFAEKKAEYDAKMEAYYQLTGRRPKEED